jgi:hypothetical protein
MNFALWIVMRLQHLNTLLFTLGICGSFAACEGSVLGPGPGPGGGNNPGSADGRPSSSDPDATVILPKLAMTMGTEPLPTELLSSADISVNLQGSDGFAGAVTLTAKIIDAAGADVPGYTAVVAAPTVTLATNGLGTTKVKVTTTNKVVAGAKLKITAASSVAPLDATMPMTIANQVTFKIGNDGNGACQYPGTVAVEVVVGTKVRFLATTTLGNGLQIHTGGGAQGVPHQLQGGDNTPPLMMNQAYERTTNGVGAFDWYCHQPGPNLEGNNPKISVVAPQ